MNKTNDDFLNRKLEELTIKEKIGQLLQIAPFFFQKNIDVEIFGIIRELNLDKEKIYKAGSVLGIGSAKDMISIQKKYLENNSHNIPLLFMADIIHGYKSIFPVPIALASSFNPKLAELTARISAKEASTSGIHVTFSPMADITKDPRWGRVVEGFGEDSYLASKMASAMVRGYQGKDLKAEDSLVSCVKHFAGYGASLAGRDYNTVNLSKLELYQEYLNPYKAALDAGARLIMTAFNTLDGVPCTVNKFLLKDILRDKWKSDAITISDYDSLKQIIAHGVARDNKEVAYKGLTNGLDIEMQSTAYSNHLEELISSKRIDISLLDEAVYRILKLKKDIGLFENPYKGAILDDTEKVLTKENLEQCKLVAYESMVLLENDGILPLKKDTKIALIGPYATSQSVIGPWSWHGRRDLHDSLETVLKNNIVFTKSSENIDEYTKSDFKKIAEADCIIFALGEPDWYSGEAHSRTNINLPNNQEKLLELAEKTNLSSIVLLFNGRPLVLNESKNANALLECWYLGSESSQAIKDIIFGEKNPSGKLPISFPRSVGQIPIFYNHLNTGRPHQKGHTEEYVSKYLDSPNDPMYCFGYGLSYSNFVYKNLKLSSNEITKNDKLKASIEIFNDSEISGYEVIQLYIRCHYAEVSRPVKELMKFRKVFFEKKQSKLVEFTLDINDLEYATSEGELKHEFGKYTIMIGSSSEDTLNQKFYLVEE